jgi:hypothetical protein
MSAAGLSVLAMQLLAEQDVFGAEELVPASPVEIENAVKVVFNATGYRVRDLPITADKLL